MESTMLEKGKGIIKKIVVDSVSGIEIFREEKNKKCYIECLTACENEDVVLLSYCVLDSQAHILVKGENEKAVASFVSRAAENFTAIINNGKLEIGYPFRSEIMMQKLKSEDIKDAIIYIHKLPAECNPSDYPYSSYRMLKDGYSFAVKVIRAECDNISKQEFLDWFNQGHSGRYKGGSHGKEKYADVVKASRARYLAPYQNVPEEVVVFMLAEICDRTKLPYKTAARRMSISYKKRRDVMIRTICDLMERRGHSYSEAVSLLKLKKENMFHVMLESIAELNRLGKYSYDHIVSVLGINDFYYDFLVEILRGMHWQTGYTFEQMAKMFHLKNDIISIRSRCGF